ncbi:MULTISPECIES: hypothetical protein [Streptomyces]|uniref:hypothetical protein n=1 Tax=Streptomyces TaxID=1883 RepID=UPI00204959BD|nr:MULTISPECIES: hypothetical protein [Streptomyces]UPT41779.1 hypothetical protein MWG59_10260 [Streptomyces sp. WAC00303]WIY76011.1 hypothetical protein QPM16_10120 [Streptomyces anulatus]
MIADEVRSELENLGVTSISPGMAAVAVRLAEALDELPAGDAPTSQAVVADKLATIMARLRTLAPVKSEGDSVDDIARQRDKRRAEAQSRATGSD